MLPIITLTTDFGLKDYSVGAVKGGIYSELYEARIIDISHLVNPYNVSEAAYIVKNAYQTFPKGSIHLIGIDAELTPEKKQLIVAMNGHYFLCADNGIISLIATDIKPDAVYEITLHNSPEPHLTILGAFVKAACHLARGGKPEVIGRTFQDYKVLKNVNPVTDKKGNIIYGHALYVDNFDNVITNISKKLFDKVSRNRNFTITVKKHRFTEIFSKYCDIVNFNLPVEKRESDGKKMALWNTSGYLELAIYRSDKKHVGGAQTLLGIKVQDTVTVIFENC